MVKICSGCNKEKSLDNFVHNSSSSDGYYSRCKECNHKTYLKDKKRRAKRDKQYYLENREEKLQKAKEYREHKKAENPNWKRIKEMSYKIGKPFEFVESWFNKQWMKQQAQCAICGKVFSDDDCIDHDHKTLELRGLLCNHCNWLIGDAKENSKTLQKAIEYLKGK